MHADDSALLARARGGDLDAFAELVRRYERRVQAVLVRLLEDERDVEEATQDTFVKAWSALGRFRGDAAFFTWIYRIAVNEALVRKRRRHPATEEFEDASERAVAAPCSEPESASTEAEQRRFLLERIRALPFEYRAPLVLRDLEGLSNQEVADVLGLSVAAAKSRIHRARMEIRAALEQWEQGEF